MLDGRLNSRHSWLQLNFSHRKNVSNGTAQKASLLSNLYFSTQQNRSLSNDHRSSTVDGLSRTKFICKVLNVIAALVSGDERFICVFSHFDSRWKAHWHSASFMQVHELGAIPSKKSSQNFSKESKSRSRDSVLFDRVKQPVQNYSQLLAKIS